VQTGRCGGAHRRRGTGPVDIIIIEHDLGFLKIYRMLVTVDGKDTQ
jgi:hypothetical protein